MNLIGQKLNSLPRLRKTILVLLNDLFLAFTCWLVFGPPMASIISSDIKISLFELNIHKFFHLLFQPFYFFIFLFFWILQDR